MGRFIVHIKQSGGGCDYTIACGIRMVTILADNMNQACDRFISMLGPNFESNDVDWTDDYGGYYDEQSLENATIFEVVSATIIDVSEVYKDLSKVAELQKRLKIEADEKEEYERLKKKFE